MICDHVVSLVTVWKSIFATNQVLRDLSYLLVIMQSLCQMMQIRVVIPSVLFAFSTSAPVLRVQLRLSLRPAACLMPCHD